MGSPRHQAGRVVRELDSGLGDIHLMEFLRLEDDVYAFGDCVKGTGVARIPLAGGTPERSAGRGDVAVLLDDSTLVLGRRFARDPYGRGTDASLAFVDLESRKIVSTVALPDDPRTS